MTHGYTNPDLPLSDENKVISSGSLLASGEAHYFDFNQSHVYFNGSGINSQYPNPSSFSVESGIYKTYSADSGSLADNAVFAWSGFRQLSGFSNSPDQEPEVPEVSFNDYIHYLPDYPDHAGVENKPENRKAVYISYISDASRSSSDLRSPYSFDSDGLFSLYKLLTPYEKGYCLFPDGRCLNGYTADECQSYPGAIYSKEPCDD